MKKLLNGIIDFRKNVRLSYKDTFAKLALGQAPDTLFIACSDSRVVPNLFASTDPGDLFVIRNVANLVPCFHCDGSHHINNCEAAALEFSLNFLPIENIIVCGHSECGGMRALLSQSLDDSNVEHLRDWLSHGAPSLETLKSDFLDFGLEPHNRLSQINVLQQIKHLQSYPIVQKRLREKTLNIFGWWFDIGQADVYSYDSVACRFILLDELNASRLLFEMDSKRI